MPGGLEVGVDERWDLFLFSLLARVDHIGPVDQSTGKTELRFFINDIEKMVSYSEDSRDIHSLTTYSF